MRSDEGSACQVLHGAAWVLISCAVLGAGCRKGTPPAQSAAPGPPPAASPGQPRASSAPAPLPRDLAPILDAYRKIIVLVEDATTLEAADQERADVAGRLLYQQKHQDLTALSDALTSQLRAKPPVLTRTTAFLDAVETHSELHDADKLAFADVLDALSEAAAGVPGADGERLRARVKEDIAGLGEIQALYQKELEKIFGRFETRGNQVRREAWESYVAFLRARYQPKAILASYEAELRQVAGTRGSRAAENPLETTGSRLPPKTLVLTFDDGPHVTRTDQIIAILKRFGVKAVFFQVGQNVATGAREDHATRASAAGRHVVDAGYTIGNHSYSHVLLPKLSDLELAEDLERTNKALASESPARVTLFRPPYGARNQKVLAAVQARQMKSVLWNIDSKDWADPISLSIANRVLKQVDGEKRGILLFHDIQKQTVEALPAILETLQARGYRFLAWNGSEFVDENPPAAAAAQEEAAPPLYRAQREAAIRAMQRYSDARIAYEKYLELQPNGAYAAAVRAHLREAMSKH